MTDVLNSEQREEFAQRGVLHLPGMVPDENVAAMRDRTWDHLGKRHGLYRNAPQDWPAYHIFKQPKAASDITKGAAFQNLVQPPLQAVIDDLLDHQPTTSYTDKCQLLITFPNPNEEWDVPHNVWHLDFPRVPDWPGPVGVQIFAFLEEARPKGGGTLVIAGSHRLLHNPKRKIRSKDLKKKLKTHSPYIASILNKDTADRTRFMTETGQTDGVDLQVVELTGKPGDVWIMDMGMMHTLAPNSLDSARMMLTQRFIPERVMAMAYSGEDEKVA